MYCLSLHALALDRQVMEAVWPNNMALGQIWAENKRRAEGNRGFTIWPWEVNKRQVTPNTQPRTSQPKSPSAVPPAQASCPRGRSVRHGSRWWWCWSRPSPADCWCSGWEPCGPTALWVEPSCSPTWCWCVWKSESDSRKERHRGTKSDRVGERDQSKNDEAQIWRRAVTNF